MVCPTQTFPCVNALSHNLSTGLYSVQYKDLPHKLLRNKVCMRDIQSPECCFKRLEHILNWNSLWVSSLVPYRHHYMREHPYTELPRACFCHRPFMYAFSPQFGLTQNWFDPGVSWHQHGCSNHYKVNKADKGQSKNVNHKTHKSIKTSFLMGIV